MTKPIPYAHLCADCNHKGSDHRLAEDAATVAGPYRCLHCNCEQPQDGPFVPLNRQEFEAWAAANR